LHTKEKWTDDAFKAMARNWSLWELSNPQAGPTERFKTVQRIYEKHLYGATSRDLTLGKMIHYKDNGDGTSSRIETPVKGYFKIDLTDRGAPLSAVWERDKSEVGKGGSRLNYKELLEDQRIIKNSRDEMIALAAAGQETTSIDSGSGSSLLDIGVETGFGSTTGVIPPAFINMLLELTSLKAFMKNVIGVQPMPDMSFKFPLKTSVIEDDAGMQRAAVPTVEGRAGLDYRIQWLNWEVNGWKYLRHAELTDEIREMVDKFLGVSSSYMEDLATGQTLLWDYAAIEGILTMLIRGVWRYPRLAAGTFTWTEDGTNEVEIPFGKASVLTTNAKLNYLWQDLSNATASDGIIYEPDTVTTDEFDWKESTARPGSTTSDDILEGFLALGTLLKNKGSKMEYIVLSDSRITERLMKDARMANLTIRTGDPKFQNEEGYLGQIAIGGSSTFTDLWESPNGLIIPRATDDATGVGGPFDAYPIIGGAYGRGWHQGVFSPISARIDEGFEVVDIGTPPPRRLRPSESKVLTTSSKGSSWPGDYHHIAILWAMFDAH
jgi:hypothetical protein